MHAEREETIITTPAIILQGRSSPMSGASLKERMRNGRKGTPRTGRGTHPAPTPRCIGVFPSPRLVAEPMWKAHDTSWKATRSKATPCCLMCRAPVRRPESKCAGCMETLSTSTQCWATRDGGRKTGPLSAPCTSGYTPAIRKRQEHTTRPKHHKGTRGRSRMTGQGRDHRRGRGRDHGRDRGRDRARVAHRDRTVG